MNRKKKPLYRKVNTKARGVRHDFGGDYKNTRNSKKRSKTVKMKRGVKRGLDYTPLFKFLLSRVGRPWEPTHSEAISRLDKEDLIWYIVLRTEEDLRWGAKNYVRVGESSYYSRLYVDEKGLLQKIDPSFDHTTLTPDCKCCTHTFNGIQFTKKYKE
jgi:hypothetical protein